MLPITKQVLRQVALRYHGHRAKSQATIIDAISGPISRTTTNYGISTFLRRAHFLAQICTESDGFCTLTEYASGAAYEGRIKRLGNDHEGDGVRFKGRGLIQLTGRANYRRFGKRLGLPLESQPELAAEPAIAVTIACDYWKSRNINHFADIDDIDAVTRLVNGGSNGLAQRWAYLVRAKAVLNAVPPSHQLWSGPDTAPPGVTQTG